MKAGPLIKGNKHFDNFFAKLALKSGKTKLIAGRKLAAKFKFNVLKVCQEYKLESVTEEEKERNISIIGALIGELTPLSDDKKLDEYILDKLERYPSVALTCLVHIKKKDPRYQCGSELKNRLIIQHDNVKDGAIRFQLISLLEMLEGKKLNATEIANLKKPETKNVPEIKEEEEEEEEEKEDEDEFLGNPYRDKVRITRLSKIKSMESFDEKNWTISGMEIFDGLEPLFSLAERAGNTELLLEMIIFRAAETINAECQIVILMKYLEHKRKVPQLRSVIGKKKAQILNITKVDNPRWASKVLEMV